MNNLSSIPNEIYLLICEASDADSIMNLSLTCRSNYEIWSTCPLLKAYWWRKRYEEYAFNQLIVDYKSNADADCDDNLFCIAEHILCFSKKRQHIKFSPQLLYEKLHVWDVTHLLMIAIENKHLQCSEAILFAVSALETFDNGQDPFLDMFRMLRLHDKLVKDEMCWKMALVMSNKLQKYFASRLYPGPQLRQLLTVEDIENLYRVEPLVHITEIYRAYGCKQPFFKDE